MAKPTKSRKPETLGKGKVTPIQVAFIVDRYLSDNDFTQSRSAFRAEALHLISKTNIKEAPKSLMTLDEILDEYISLKGQRVLMEQERAQVEYEKLRVASLLKGMQGVMDAYNESSRVVEMTSGSFPSWKDVDVDVVPQSSPYVGTPSDKVNCFGNFDGPHVVLPDSTPNTTPVVQSVSWNANTPPERSKVNSFSNFDDPHMVLPENTPNITPMMQSVSWNANTPPEPTNFSAASTSVSFQNKRKGSRHVSDVSTSSKKQCSRPTRKVSSSAGKAHNTDSDKQKISSTRSSSRTNSEVSCHAHGSSVRESSVAKNLFQQASPPVQSSSPSPKTPPQECTSQVDNSPSPLDNSSVINSNVINTPQADNFPSALDSSSVINSNVINTPQADNVPSPLDNSSVTNSNVINTPQADNSLSPLDNSHVFNSNGVNTPQDITPSTCAAISSSLKTTMVSPSKHLTHQSMEQCHHAPPSSPAKSNWNRQGTRDQVKGRLDFGASDVSMSSEPTATTYIPTSGTGENIFNMDTSDFDIFNSDVSLSAFLINIELECSKDLNAAIDVLSGLSDGSGNGNSEATQSFTELPSNESETLSERDMNIQDQDSSASLKPLAKSVKLAKSAKKRTSSIMDQENLVAKN